MPTLPELSPLATRPAPGAHAFAGGLIRAALFLAVAGLVGGATPRAFAAGEEAGPARHAVFAGSASDTLPYAWRDVLPVAIVELERNNWTIQRADTVERRVVTRWKPLKHVLVRVFLGDVLARCVIDLEPNGAQGTIIRMRGGLASENDIENNPGFPKAVQTYQGASERFLAGVRNALDDRARRGLVARAGAPEIPAVPELSPR